MEQYSTHLYSFMVLCLIKQGIDLHGVVLNKYTDLPLLLRCGKVLSGVI